MRVLLVEDDALLADGLLRALRHDGYAVDHVSRGDQVLAALTDGHFAAVLLVIGLPGLDGLQALLLVRDRCMPSLVIVIRDCDLLDARIRGLVIVHDVYLELPF